MSDNKMYDILGKFNNLDPKLEPVKETKAKETVYEEVEARGDIMEAVRNLEEKYQGFKKTVAAIKKGGSAEDPEAVAAAIGRKKYGKAKFQKAAAAGKKLGEAAKPDYIDLDKDGDKKESMKKAAKDAKKKAVKEGEYDPAPIDPEAVAKRKRLQAIKDRQEAERAEKGGDYKSNVRTIKGKAYGGAAQKDDADDLDEAMSDEAKLERYHELIKRGMDPDDAEVEVFNDEGDEDLDEVAPPGAKAERMVKHIKKGYAKDGKLTKKEKGIAYATAWKAHNKGKLQESRMIQEGDYFYEKLGKALAEKNPTLNTADPSFVTAVRQEMVAQGIEPNRARNIIMMDRDFIGDVATSYGHYCKEIAECNAPINSTLGGTTVEQELDEIARLAGLPVQETEVYDAVNTEESRDDMEEGNAFTGKLALTKKGEKFSIGNKEYTDTSDLGESALEEEEEEMGEGNEFSGALAKARASGAKDFEVDGKRYTVKEDVMLAADGADDVVSLIRKLAGMDPVSTDPAAQQVAVAAPTEPQGMEPTDSEAEEIIAATSGEPDIEEDRDVEYVNTPRELIAPVDAAIPSGTDMHRSKEQYKKAQDGDNAMAVKEDSLWKRYTGMLKELITSK